MLLATVTSSCASLSGGPAPPATPAAELAKPPTAGATSIEAGRRADEIVGAWQLELDRFKARRERYLLY